MEIREFIKAAQMTDSVPEKNPVVSYGYLNRGLRLGIVPVQKPVESGKYISLTLSQKHIKSSKKFTEARIYMTRYPKELVEAAQSQKDSVPEKNPFENDPVENPFENDKVESDSAPIMDLLTLLQN